MTKVIVTGGNGFIGTHTIEELVRRGFKVTAIDLEDDNLKGNCDFINCDILSNDLEKYISHGDKVLHLAAVARFDKAEQNPTLSVRVNVEGTLNVINACIRKKADRLVYSSTGSVYSTDAPIPIREDALRMPSSIYGLTKKMAEDLIFFYGNKLPYIILRYGYVYGRGKDWGAIGAFIKNIRRGKPPVIFGGKQTNDFIYIKDVVQANILGLETEYLNQVYNIGTGRAVSIKDVCEICLKAMNADIKPIVEPARAFDFPVFVYDISKAEVLLKFRPKWSLLDGVKGSLFCEGHNA